MAVAYHTEDSQDWAAGQWSDTTGFAAGATLVMNKNRKDITTSIDQSALAATGIESIEIGPGVNCLIGGVAGSAIFNCAASATAHFNYGASGGSLYYSANGNGGGTDDIKLFRNIGSGNAYLTGGDFRSIHTQSGLTRIAAATTILDSNGLHYGVGGTSYFDSHATDVIPTSYLTSGVHTYKRGSTTIYLGGSATLILDSESNNSSVGAATIVMLGGTLRWISGNITTFYSIGGLVDCRDASRPLSVVTTLNDGPDATWNLLTKGFTVSIPAIGSGRTKIGTGANGLT